MLSTVVCHELAVPGVEDDEAWFNEAAADGANQVKSTILLWYSNAFQNTTSFFNWAKTFHYAKFIYSYIKKRTALLILIATSTTPPLWNVD